MENGEKIGYAFAKVESWLLQYEKEHEMSGLIGQVGRLLLNGHEPGLNDRGPKTVPTTKKLDKLGRPRTTWGHGKHPYWSKMTEEQRQAEGRRRREVRRQNKVLAAKHSNRPMGGVA